MAVDLGALGLFVALALVVLPCNGVGAEDVDGSEDGGSLGCDDGARLGFDDGYMLSLGFKDGDLLGSDEGGSLGCDDGDLDGAKDCSKDGAEDGGPVKEQMLDLGRQTFTTSNVELQ